MATQRYSETFLHDLRQKLSAFTHVHLAAVQGGNLVLLSDVVKEMASSVFEMSHPESGRNEDGTVPSSSISVLRAVTEAIMDVLRQRTYTARGRARSCSISI